MYLLWIDRQKVVLLRILKRIELARCFCASVVSQEVKEQEKNGNVNRPTIAMCSGSKEKKTTN
jgi:hypothetical protein